MIYVEERPWWPIQSPNEGRKKKAKAKRREIKSSSMTSDLKEDKLRHSERKMKATLYFL